MVAGWPWVMDTSDQEIRVIQPLDSFRDKWFLWIQFESHFTNPRSTLPQLSKSTHTPPGYTRRLRTLQSPNASLFQKPGQDPVLQFLNDFVPWTSLAFWFCSCIKLSHVTGNSQSLGYKACIRQSAVQGRVQRPGGIWLTFHRKLKRPHSDIESRLPKPVTNSWPFCFGAKCRTLPLDNLLTSDQYSVPCKLRVEVPTRSRDVGSAPS